MRTMYRLYTNMLMLLSLQKQPEKLDAESGGGVCIHSDTKPNDLFNGNKRAHITTH